MTIRIPSVVQCLRPIWKEPHFFSKSELTPEIKRWLLFSGSFTQKLVRISKESQQEVKIGILNESLETAKELALEYGLFHCKFVYTREILIFLGEALVMYARSVVPKTENFLFKKRFKGLGEHPLGEILFNCPRITRSQYNLAKVTSMHKEYSLAAWGSKGFPKYIWARRSTFNIDKPFLLLTEFFAPNFWTMPNDN